MQLVGVQLYSWSAVSWVCSWLSVQLVGCAIIGWVCSYLCVQLVGCRCQYTLPCTHSSLLDVCQQALDLNEGLIATDQLLYHKDMKGKFQKMLTTLAPLIEEDEDEDKVSIALTHLECNHNMLDMYIL